MSFRTRFIRIAIVMVIILTVFYMPMREFVKVTLLFGIPFIIFMRFISKKSAYPLGWVISLIGLLVVGAGYIYMLSNLPERIETRKIVSEGAALVAEGKYDQAITLYRNLEKVNQKAEMQEKIAEAEREKQAYIILTEAKAFLHKGDREEALNRIDTIPENTKAAREARRILEEFE